METSYSSFRFIVTGLNFNRNNKYRVILNRSAEKTFFKSRLAVLILIVFCSFSSMAQIAVTVTGNTNTTPNLAASYTSLGNAITALNTVTFLSGPVTFDLAAGTTESVAAQQTITTAGDLSFAITFQKSGAGANPLLTRTDAGTNATSTLGGLGDGIIRIDGTDNIHFNGLDIAASNQGIEYGYYTHKPSVTDACQTFSIKNCALTMNKGTSAFVTGIYISNGTVSTSSATGVTVTTNSGRTENVTITGNTISNVYIGIYCLGYFSGSLKDQNFVIGTSGTGNGNIIQNFGASFSTAAAAYGVYISNNNNVIVDYNTIDNAGGGGIAHDVSIYGVRFNGATGVISGSNNIIRMTTIGSGLVDWIQISGTATSLTFNNNSFAGSIAATTTSYFIEASTATLTVTATGNTTSGTILKTGASGLLYGFSNTLVPGSGLSTITNNDFSNITLSGTSGFTGIRQSTLSGHNANVSGNVISNIIVPGTFIGIEYDKNFGNCNDNTISGITGGATCTGILAGSSSTTGTQNVFNNTISSISSSGASIVTGIQSAASGTGAVSNVYKNKICDLSATDVASQVYGISITAGKTTNAYNNLIANLTASNATGNNVLRGISITSTTTSSNNNIDFNTIYLNSSGAGNFGSSGIFHTTSATSTTSNLTMRNNIIYNNSTPAGTGVTAAYRRSSTTNTNFNNASNRNLFWGGTPSPTQLIFTNGTNSYDQLGNYKTFMATRDQNSQTENVQFQSTSCSSADYLKYNQSIVTLVESGGVNIAGITDDYVGSIRHGNVGYSGSGSAPDIGAWELEPGCSGNPVNSNAQITNANPCPGANFTLSLDVMFSRFTFQWEESTIGSSSGFSSIAGAFNPTYTTSTPITKWYRCAVTCEASSLTTTSASVQVSITAIPLAGTYSINNAGGGNYLSIAAAVADLNCKGISGPVTFNVASGHTENSTSQITITTTGTVANPIVFQGTGTHPLITRTDAGTNTTSTFGGLGDAVIRMEGSDYITFDAVDIAASNQGIEYGYFTYKPGGTNGCQFVTIKNSVITLTKGTSSNVLGIYISNGPTLVSSATGVTVSSNTGRNEYITITGNTISNVHAGIYCLGYSSSTLNDQNIVIGEIGTGNGNTIQNFGGGAASTAYGVFVSNTNNVNIDYNIINNAGGGGTAHISSLFGVRYTGVTGVISGSNNFIAINTSSTSQVLWISNSATVASITFNNNTLAGSIASTSTNTLILANTATPIVTITGNVISGTLFKTGTSGTLSGFSNNSSPAGGTSTITNNNFSNINVSGNSNFTGIRQAANAGHNANVSGNTISNITAPGTFRGIEYLNNFGNCNDNTISGITGGDVIGILAGSSSTTGTQNVYNNTVSSMSSSSFNPLTGIESAASGAGAVSNIYKNKICDLSGSDLTYGLSITAGITTNVYNNLIGNLTVINATGSDAVRGISITSTTTSSNNFIDFNTIYLNAAGTTNFGTSGIFHTASAISTTSNLTMRNNIIYNNSTQAGTGVTAAYRRSSTDNANYNNASDRNLFWGGTPSATKLIFTNGTNSYNLLSGYKTYMVTRDQNSQTENVQFLNTSCASPDFLKYNQSIVSVAESGGINITGITDDYIGSIRQGNPGYSGSGSAPDIGAWELQFGCSGSPSSSNAQTTNATPCSGTNFTLSLNIVFGGGFYSFQWEESIIGPSSGFTPISGATNSTYTTSTFVTKWYRCAVTCITSSQTTPSVSVQVFIDTTPLSGIYSISNLGGANYLSIAAAVSDLNCKGISGPVTFNVASGHIESSSSEIVINATGTSANPIVFQGTGTHPVITRNGGSINTTSTFGGLGDAIIRMNGCDYITFDKIDLSTFSPFIEYGYFNHKPNGTNGSQFVTIKNCVITMSKGTSAFVCGIYISNGPTSISSAIGVTASSDNGRNKNITITGNTISNVHAGIFCRGSSSGSFIDQNFVIGSSGTGNGNTIQNYGGGSETTSYGIFTIYLNNANIDYNTIDNAGGGGTAHNSNLYGIYFNESSGAMSASNNIITLAITSSNYLNAYWINSSSNLSSISINNNAFAGTMAHEGSDYLIYNSSNTPAVTVSGNQTSGTISNSVQYGHLTGYYSTGSPTGGLSTISNNNFSNISLKDSASYLGITHLLSTAGHQANVSGNTISNITCGFFYGIYYNYSFGNINNNTVSSITAGEDAYGISAGNSSTTGTTNIYSNIISSVNTVHYKLRGIQSNASGSGSVTNIYKNKICGLYNPGTYMNDFDLPSSVYGIEIKSGPTTNIYNNLIGNLSAPNAFYTSVIGIVPNGTTKIDYNTIYLNYSANESTNASIGIRANASTILRNNIIYNISTPSPSVIGEPAAIEYNSASDNNLFYFGTSSTEWLSYHKIKMSSIGADQNSVTENVIFLSTTCASPDFLKYDASIASLAESGASNIAGITTDYIGVIRHGNVGYAGTGTSPDIGAWELEPSGCSGTPAACNAQILPGPCSGANITLELDIAFRSASYAFQWQESTTGPSSGFSAIPFATNATYTTTAIPKWYRCIVTCMSSTLSATSSSVQVFGAALAGIYTINNGGGGDYLSFTAAVTDLINRGICSPVIFNVAAGSGPYTEQISIPSIGGASSINTITFNGNGRILQYNPPTSDPRHVIKLDGADYVTFNNLIISCTSQLYGWGVHFRNYANYNTLNACTINLSISSTTNNLACIVARNSTVNNDIFNYNNANKTRITGCTLTGGYNAIEFRGKTDPGEQDQNNEFSNNILRDFDNFSIEFSGQSGAVISGNDFSRPTRTNNSGGTGALNFFNQSNSLIEKNRIHNFFDASPNYSGIFWGISASTGVVGQPTRIENNIVYNINHLGRIYGIDAKASVSDLLIYHNTIALDNPSATTDITYGLYLFQTTGGHFVDLKNNIITIRRGGTGIKYGLYINLSGNILNSNYNNIYLNSTGSGAQYVGYRSGTNYATLANWQTANGGAYDQQSRSVDPQYTNASNADFTPTSITLDNLGINVGVTTDIIGSVRSISNPDPGAYEFPSTPNCATYNYPSNGATNICSPANVTLSWTAALAGVPTSSYDVYFGTSPIPPFLVNVSTTSYSTAVVANQTYYWKIVPRNLSIEATGCPTFSFNTVSTDDGNACTDDGCNTSSGVFHNAVVTDDGNACTDDGCDTSSGVYHNPVSMDDGNACTTDACNTSTGAITHNAVSVDDGNACTTDACNISTGAITHDAVSIDDGNACTTDACNTSTGAITHDAVSIDDGNACTTDACNTSTGAISHIALNTDDGNACTTDACNTVSGAITHTAVNTDDGNACTTDACNTSTGAITHDPVLTDDSNACTDDGCNNSSGVFHNAVSTDDGNACTTDGCNSISGIFHNPVNIDDGNACTLDVCNTFTGAIIHNPIATDDGNACTTDACNTSIGAITHTAVSTDDGNACTDDGCNTSTGAITHTPVSTDDGNACTDDGCNTSTGVFHNPVNTDDGNACTDDGCNSSTGVFHNPVNTDDGNACTDDGCNPSSGVFHNPVVTDDGNVCTIDGCTPGTGVFHSAISVDDNNVCTIDGCDSLTGPYHTPVNVDDNSLCTTDGCDPLIGVFNIFESNNDNNACTNDYCVPSTGYHHDPINVDDSNACTDDGCNTSSGVFHNPVTTDDGNVCTDDGCNTSTGVFHNPVHTDDGNACTTDACNTSTGTITHNAVSVDDGNVCTTDACNTSTGAITHDAVSVDDGVSCTIDACNSITGVSHTPVNCAVVLNANILLQGYYIGGGLMNALIYNLDQLEAVPNPAITSDMSDYITISAMEVAPPHNLVDAQVDTLRSNGAVNVTFGPAIVANTSYYIKVDHRNSVETWSADPVPFLSTTSYTFSTPNQSYGPNMAEVELGIWAIYTGEVEKDGAVDISDFLALDPSIQAGDGGYLPGDLNGDGSVDITDFLILDPNVQLGLGANPVP